MSTQPPAPKPTLHDHERLMSPLTRRILAVNLLAPALLLIGTFYLGEYRRSLVTAELSSLRTHGEIFAVALGESAVSPAGENLMPELASQIVRRLAFTADTRARLFAVNGMLVADSRALLEPGGEIVEAESLAPPAAKPAPETVADSKSLLNKLFALLDVIYFWLPGVEEYPLYHENIDQHAEDYREVMGAMEGDIWVARRSMPDGTLILSVALPVTRYKQTLGVLMLSKTSADINDAMFEVRKATLQVFAATLIFTVLVSLYLGGTIARPIRNLSRAAERVRKGRHREHTIPKMTARTDEIGELALALNDMTEGLWARMDAIEAFAADVSHEIKNPLTSLKSAVETATRLKDPDAQRKLMAVILDDVERLDRLITDISNASRLDAELSRAEPKPVNLSAMLTTIADIHTASLSENAPTLSIAAPAESEGSLMVSGIADRLVQVLRNLISNAQSFSPQTPDAAIRITAGREGAWVVITVEDDGPGIPEGKFEAIFNRFYTERPQAEEFGRHSGLGLAISKQIVEAHGGTIIAENAKTEDGAVTGARFTVRLPAA
ncbi:MAG: sensor histidine kinase [Rhodospirillales bacterium]|nr:sensor histidine kinase [Rhodospirillales bacterium]